MRWVHKKKVKPEPRHNEIRVISKFLFFPMCIEGEYRWLERVNIEQKYSRIELFEFKGADGRSSFFMTGGFWIDLGYKD